MSRSRWRLSTDLILWHSIALAVVCFGIGLFSYRLVFRSLETSLHQEAREMAEKISEGVREPLWILDRKAIEKFIQTQNLHPDLLNVRVENQFGDVLAVWRSGFTPVEPMIEHTLPVTYRGETIGQVCVSLSSRQIKILQSGLLPLIIAITVCGIIAQLFLTWLLTYRFLRIPLFALINNLRHLARGRYDQISLPEAKHQEIHLLQNEAHLMAERIKERTELLQKEIKERERAEAKLIEYRDHLEELIRKRTLALAETNLSLRREIEKRQTAQNAIINISTREQQRIGQNMHDTLGQNIVAARFMVDALERDIAASVPESIPRTRQLSKMLNDIMEQARSLAHGLMIVDLREGGLAYALSKHAKKTSDLFPVKCFFRQIDDFPEIEQPVTLQLYYIAQEALNNAIRHGKASLIRISLHRRYGIPRMTIVDNGSGFIPEAAEGGMGLKIMQHRAESIGAELIVWSRCGIGTCIICELSVRLN